jgi:hypothetical protein
MEYDNKPTLKGEIKKAKGSNYTTERCINEFVDNALDTIASAIYINFITCLNIINKFQIADNSDNGISINIIKAIFSWTFDKERKNNDISEFGTGFKSASVNMGWLITLYTFDKINNKYLKCVANWKIMSDKNNWVPELYEINKKEYENHHLFSNGSSFIIEELLEHYKYIDVNSDRGKHILVNFKNELSSYYKYIPEKNKIKFFINYKELIKENININAKEYNFNDNIIDYFGISQKIIETHIKLYKNKNTKEIICLINNIENNNNKSNKCYIYCVHKFKNGNYKLKVIDNIKIDDYEYIDIELHFKSCTTKGYGYNNDEDLIMPNGTVDVIRNNRVLGKNLTTITHRADGYSNKIKHELRYTHKELNEMLGVSYNKSHDGHIPENNLKYCLHYLQKQHEKELQKFEENLPKLDDKQIKYEGEYNNKHKYILSKYYNKIELSWIGKEQSDIYELNIKNNDELVKKIETNNQTYIFNDLKENTDYHTSIRVKNKFGHSEYYSKNVKTNIKSVSKQELTKQELAKQEPAKQELTKQELTKQELTKQELSKQELSKQELAKQELAKQELAKQELTKQELTKQELTKQELTKQELAKQELTKQELAKQEVITILEPEPPINEINERQVCIKWKPFNNAIKYNVIIAPNLNGDIDTNTTNEYLNIERWKIKKNQNYNYIVNYINKDGNIIFKSKNSFKIDHNNINVALAIDKTLEILSKDDLKQNLISFIDEITSIYNEINKQT